MKIDYRWEKNFDIMTVQELFESVGWESAKYPELLIKALAGSSKVVSAWSDGRLIGLMNALDDGALNAYFHYLLVRPDYQKHGVGRELVRLMRQQYPGYLSLTLVAVEGETAFFHNCGFRSKTRMLPLFLDSQDEPEAGS